MSNNKKLVKPDLKSEIDELQRVVQYLSRDENINISVNELVKKFNDSNEERISDNVWKKLENTESNEIEKGDMKAVYKIAKMYNKTNPKKLAQSFADGDYKRPLIVQFGDRYHLVAGNTRLSTAAALGIKPYVFIAKIGDTKKIETKEETGADSSGSFSGPAFGGVTLKKDLYKLHNSKKYNTNKEVEADEATTASSSGGSSTSAFAKSNKKKDWDPSKNTQVSGGKFVKESEEEFKEATDASSSGSYDVPLFGKTSKGRRDPLKIDGEKSIKQSRAVKDKKFPKWGGPDSVFIKVKDKCKKFPYCNQGDINAIELLEMEELTQSVIEVANEMGIPYKEIEKIVLNEIKQIFI